MADESLIEEMRAAIRGDRERAEERRRREQQPASAVQLASPPGETGTLLDDELQQPGVDAEPAVERGPVGHLRWLRRRRTS